MEVREFHELVAFICEVFDQIYSLPEASTAAQTARTLPLESALIKYSLVDIALSAPEEIRAAFVQTPLCALGSIAAYIDIFPVKGSC